MKARDWLRVADKVTQLTEEGQVRRSAQELALRLRNSERVREQTEQLRDQAKALQSGWQQRADQHLETVLARRGETLSAEAEALLLRRRAERERQEQQLRWRRHWVALGQNTEQRRILALVARKTDWLGGQGPELRYTEALDTLASRGRAEDEMRVHRALWTLAEKGTLSVSPHGVVRAVRSAIAFADSPALP